MSFTSLFSLTILCAIVIINVISGNINCHDETTCVCFSSAQCQLNCIGYEICKGSGKTLACIDNGNCEIVCNGEDDGKACVDATIYTHNTTNTTVNCMAYEDCKSTKLYSFNTNLLTINCMENNGKAQNCQDMTVDAHLSSSVEVNCNGYLSCKKMDVTCGIDCIVNCNANQGHVCEGLNLVCGTGLCQINCQGYNKCPSITIDTQKATRFICIGSQDNCASAPAPFIVNPTTFPSTNPTVYNAYVYTNNPTVYSANPTTSKPTNVIFELDNTYAQNLDTTLYAHETETTKVIVEHTNNIFENWLFIYSMTGVVIAMLCCVIVICIIVKNKKRKRRKKGIKKCLICPCITRYFIVNASEPIEGNGKRKTRISKHKVSFHDEGLDEGIQVNVKDENHDCINNVITNHELIEKVYCITSEL